METGMVLQCVESFALCLTPYNNSLWMTTLTCLQQSDNYRQGDLSYASNRYGVKVTNK